MNKITNESIDELYKGVHISSRRDIEKEIIDMRRVVDYLESDANRIESIWCDSKAGSMYTITVKPKKWAPYLYFKIKKAFLSIGGYNGVLIESDTNSDNYLEPNWPEDYIDDQIKDEKPIIDKSTQNQSDHDGFNIEENRSINNSDIDLLRIKKVIVDNFVMENFLELGVVTGWGQYIRNHSRLLRSLRWQDSDYPGNVLDLLMKMQEKNDGSLEKLFAYLSNKFPGQEYAMSQTNISPIKNSVLGYNYTKSRDDIIGIMMPFTPKFRPVYEAIQKACAHTKFPTRRADEVWNHSAVIHDILELINHSVIVICDLTDRNENVFYELGVAHAWGKTVIPITQNEMDVPFDLRHHRYLKYLNNGEGLKTLEIELSKRVNHILCS